jgi:hypothetical protein
MRKRFAMVVLAVLFGCRPAPETNTTNEAAPEPARNEAPPIASPAPGTPGGLPDDRTPLIEPKGPIDPKSAEAAGQVMQHYGALLEQRRFADAAALWGDAAAAAAFARQFGDASEVHLQVGKPDDTEGAAGSIYVTVPVAVYGRAPGGEFSRSGSATLRRVNDVPGSTEAQRRWHIERIELGAAG